MNRKQGPRSVSVNFRKIKAFSIAEGLRAQDWIRTSTPYGAAT
jgi:hypothetical protein